MKVVILAAGAGTRLAATAQQAEYSGFSKNFPNLSRPLFERVRRQAMDSPKPLVEIGGKPLLQHTIELIERIRSEAVDKVAIVSNETNYPAMAGWARNYRGPLAGRIEIINNRQVIVPGVPQNRVAQDLELGLAHTAESAMVMVGDRLFDDATEADGLVRASKDAIASTLASYGLDGQPLDLAIRILSSKGVVTTGDGGKVLTFQEKPRSPDVARSKVAMGWYFLRREDLAAAYEYFERGTRKENLGNLMEYLLVKDTPVVAYPIRGGHHDIGDFSSLLEAETAAAEKMGKQNRA